MKKQLIIVGIIVLLICVGLSGCNETSYSFDEVNLDNIGKTVTIEVYLQVTPKGGWETNWTGVLYSKELGQTGGTYYVKEGTDSVNLIFPSDFNVSGLSGNHCRVTGLVIGYREMTVTSVDRL